MPALILAERLPVKRAIATSLLVVSINSLAGFLGDLATGASPDWPLLLSFTGLAGLGMLAGTSLTRKISDHHVRIIFGYVLIAMAALTVFLELHR